MSLEICASFGFFAQLTLIVRRTESMSEERKNEDRRGDFVFITRHLVRNCRFAGGISQRTYTEIRPKRIRTRDSVATIAQSKIPCRRGRTPTSFSVAFEMPVPIR